MSTKLLSARNLLPWGYHGDISLLTRPRVLGLCPAILFTAAEMRLFTVPGVSEGASGEAARPFRYWLEFLIITFVSSADLLPNW